VKEGSLDGVLGRVTDSRTTERFCGDSIGGELTRGPHTTPASRADVAIFRAYMDVHAPRLLGTDEGTAIGSPSLTISRNSCCLFHQPEVGRFHGV